MVDVRQPSSFATTCQLLVCKLCDTRMRSRKMRSLRRLCTNASHLVLKEGMVLQEMNPNNSLEAKCEV
eukprot:5439235-Amphidinium_carterae.2